MVLLSKQAHLQPSEDGEPQKDQVPENEYNQVQSFWYIEGVPL